MFFHIYDLFSIPCLAVLHFFLNVIEFFTAIHKHFTFSSHICSFKPMTTCGLFLAIIILFPYLYQYDLKLYTLVFIYKIPMPIKCYIDSITYFTFVSHICSFTSMIPYIFLVCLSCVFENAYEVFIAIHKHFTFGSHICC